MLKIGSHVGMGAKEYLVGSVKEALSYNANTFMFYTGAPQNTFRAPLTELKIKEFKEMLKESNIDINDLVVHAPYIINLANLDDEKNEFAYSVFTKEIERTIAIGCKYLVLHPGASLDYDRDEAINRVGKLINQATKTYENIVVLIETMAGKGSEVGKNFDEIKSIIDLVENKDRVGVCLDTCHINDAGYDLRNFDKVLDEFDEKIGLDYIKVIHLNDSKNQINTHKDRHENIGYGTIGFDILTNVVYNKRIEDRIFILETPYVKPSEKSKLSFAPYKKEIEMIRNKEFNKDLINEILEENI